MVNNKNNKNNILITLNGLSTYTNVYKDKLILESQLYYNTINNNKKLKNIYKILCKNILSYQKGGDISSGTIIIAGVSSSLLLIGVAALVYYWWVYPRCKPSYPLTPTDEIRSPADIILNMMPSNWKKAAEGRDPIGVLHTIQDYIHTMMVPLEILNTDGAGISKKIAVNTTRFITGAAAAVATLGAGGDILINFLFTVQSTMDTVISFIDNIIEIATDTDSIRLLYDIFLIDFTDGPFGVECWIEYIIKTYGDTNNAYLKVCTFFNNMIQKLANFLGNLLSTMIPDNAGLVAMIVPPLIVNFRDGFFSAIEDKLNEYYDKIPEDYQQMLQHPELFKQFIQETLSSGANILNTLTIGKTKGATDELINMLTKNLTAIITMIHKCCALMWSLMYIFMNCKKQNEIDEIINNQNNNDQNNNTIENENPVDNEDQS